MLGTNHELFPMIKPKMHIAIRGKSDDGRNTVLVHGEWWRVKSINGLNILAINPGKSIWIKGPNCKDYEIAAINTGEMILSGRK